MRSHRWITLMVREACASHAADRRREETTANRLAVVRARVLAGVRCAIALTIETLLEADGDGADSTWTCDNAPSTQGFVVLRDDRRIGARSTAIDLDGAGLTCRYHGCRTSIEDAPERDSLTIEMGRDGAHTLDLEWRAQSPLRERGRAERVPAGAAPRAA